MGLSTAERNRRKRERKKREKEERRKEEAAAAASQADEITVDEVEIEYVTEEPSTFAASNAASSSVASKPAASSSSQETNKDDANADLNNMEDILKKFHERSAVGSSAVVSDDERKKENAASSPTSSDDEYDDYDDEDDRKPMSKRKLRDITRPTVAALKRRVKRPDLVEAHDITAADPDFLIELKSIDGTVVVPRHWGRKRKYLQGKRGFEKPPFQLPDFIVKTGITELRDTVAEDESNETTKQQNRGRVNPKMGAMDVDYKTLYEAFFKYQTKPPGMTGFGDLYYEGKEMETSTDLKPGGPLSSKLREALAIPSNGNAPPPWLINMQRYGPPPSYPDLAIPGLNAPLPNSQCVYGYHSGGWGKPPVDAYGRPLYGGTPFAPPGSSQQETQQTTGIVTSDGKTVDKASWGALPLGEDVIEIDDDSDEEGSSSEDESSDDAMEESDDEAEEGTEGVASVLPPPADGAGPGELRKHAGIETPLVDAPKQLYKVLQTKSAASGEQQQGAVFNSEVTYVVPGGESNVPEGATSVLSKAVPSNETKRKKKTDDGDEDDLGKTFKF